jgi:hypothetical protein
MRDRLLGGRSAPGTGSGCHLHAEKRKEVNYMDIDTAEIEPIRVRIRTGHDFHKLVPICAELMKRGWTWKSYTNRMGIVGWAAPDGLSREGAINALAELGIETRDNRYPERDLEPGDKLADW